MDIEGYNPGLEDFQSVFASFTQYRYKLLKYHFKLLLGNPILV